MGPIEHISNVIVVVIDTVNAIKPDDDLSMFMSHTQFLSVQHLVGRNTLPYDGIPGILRALQPGVPTN